MMPMGALLDIDKENFTLLCNVVVKTLNLEISRWCLAKYVRKCNKSKALFCDVVA